MSTNGQSFLLDPEKKAGPMRYSHARVVQPNIHHTIYISGIAAVTPDGEYEGVTENPDGTYELDIRAQTAAVLRRIESIIKGASDGKANLYNIVDATVYILDMKSQYAGMNEEWNKIWHDRASAPSRATIGVRELPDPRFLVEIKATAILITAIAKMSLDTNTKIEYFTLNDFEFQDGTILPQVQQAYREFNPTKTKIALIPTCFRGRINATLNFANGALRDYRVIVVALFGNGESSSPSNTHNFPQTLDYRDCVRAQYRLITEHLRLGKIDVMAGFSMGGQCTYHWAATYPSMILNAVIICSSAKTSLHNYQFLEGPKAALESSIDYIDGKFRINRESFPLRGLHAFGRAYSAWLTSAQWFEQRVFEKQGYKSLDDWAAVVAAKNYNDWYPDDLLVMLGMWQRSDISVSMSSSRPNGDVLSVSEALGQLSARCLLMPCQTDQYFTWQVSEKEAKYIKHAELAIIPSIWGHLAGSGASQEDNHWMDSRIALFLSQSK
ncbi:translation initiation inhibitor, putative [Talaromyces stipitatus ATCC 10500]|uniref:Translation initiation inhibitor, putative n=1 Tax=Talaromyces stipitatus (strain ATCC 10500 / CBS 375.48 / QM 6759 / NRRL 1006) TaxID=441959 RepID=B8MA31_TALSN|nr:translation initiation inhibitor, putative [Talaromyces stipitatus ATCC 10500]EED18360.1 translation initiation inhibitor, putative [Talaromyces stipitatus ATCC 10500]